MEIITISKREYERLLHDRDMLHKILKEPPNVDRRIELRETNKQKR